MRVLLAGATGAIGKPLIPLLKAAGHEVHGTTRSAEKCAQLESAGATAQIVDLLEPGAATELIARVEPDVVIDQLTSLPQVFDPRKAKAAYLANDRIRRDGSGALIDAAAAAGVGRYVAQSVAFIYRPGAPGLRSEEDPVWSDAPPPFDASVGVLTENEKKLTDGGAVTGVVLRYGFFYGPGTWYATGGSTYEAVAQRKYPLIGGGTGVSSLVHVSDAAAATAIAAERGEGVYNIVDDDPAPMGEMIPAFAEMIGARPPRGLPAWIARPVAGKYLVAAATELPGASNAKAKSELGWSPRIASWREGLRDHRDDLL